MRNQRTKQWAKSSIDYAVMSRESEARDLHECGRVDLSLGREGQGEDRGMQHEIHLTRGG